MGYQQTAHMTGQQRRKRRVRKKVVGTAERPRLTVFRSAKHLFVQVVDDSRGETLASIGTHGKAGVAKGEHDKVAHAHQVGERIAELCKDRQIQAVVFDRAGFRYHGRVQAVAEGARKGGLLF